MNSSLRPLFLTPKLSLGLLALFVLTTTAMVFPSLNSVPGVVLCVAIFLTITQVLRQLFVDQTLITISSMVFSLILVTLSSVFLLSRLS